jgi:hypothetical protein
MFLACARGIEAGHAPVPFSAGAHVRLPFPFVLVQAYAKKHQNCHACCVLDQQASIFFDSSLGESAEEAVHFPFPAKVCSS